MSQVLDFLLRHGYAALFLVVLAEQIGLPFPAAPLIIAAGALAGAGRLSLPVVVLLVVVASLIADLLWYELGRRRGMAVLRLLCRISLEPDSCVRRTQNSFGRRGSSSLLIAKFIPGFNTVAPPLAGILKMSPARFVLFDTAGILLWVAVFGGLGYVFTEQLEEIASYAETTGSWLLLVFGVLFGLYIAWKLQQRRAFIRKLMAERISPHELQARLQAGEQVVVIDLRHALDFESRPLIIPGAIRMTADELEARHETIPRDREVIVYCT